MHQDGGVVVRAGSERDAQVAARLHADEITEGFLSSLGPLFLELLYRRVVRSGDSFLLVAEQGDGIVGHAAATEDVPRLYREFLRHEGVAAGVVAAPRLLRRWRSVLETLRYPAVQGHLPKAELLAVAVSSRSRGRGVGRALVTGANQELLRRGVRDARVVVATANTAALRLYMSSGFCPAAEIHVHPDRPSQVLTWC
jgi:ribosomal protein S18 acetylase RimI-like enzyme